MIPQRVIIFWHDLQQMPASVEAAVRFSQLRNPDFDFLIADDAFVMAHLAQHYPRSFLDLYCENQIPASRSDLARLLLIAHYGGIYLDASMELQMSLSHLHITSIELLLMVRSDHAQYKNKVWKAHKTNSFFGAKPKHPTILKAIYIAFANAASLRFNDRVWYATGAYCLNQALGYGYAKASVYSFDELHQRLFIYRRDIYVNNAWKHQQIDGIYTREKTNPITR